MHCRHALLLGALGLTAVVSRASSPSRLVAHEWGTITTVHAADGTPRGKLNRIAADDTLPPFVHRYEPPATQNRPQNSLLKTPLTPGRPDVTMRLETPVIYFYQPGGRHSSGSERFDVSVRFRGGVINEFYPKAEGSVAVDVERVNAKLQAGVLKAWDGNVLDNYVVGGLRWTGLALADSATLPATSSHVWLAPRRVRSAAVVSASGESEQYLFYRGVAHLDALVQTRWTAKGIELRAPRLLLWMPGVSMTIPRLWLVDVRPDGRAAVRQRNDVTIQRDAPDAVLTTFPEFAPNEYGKLGLTNVRRSMRQALTAAGLYSDEADAMLETWKASYYGKPGLRLLYVVPREWIDYFLPLEISVPHTLTRVLIGRIDLEEM